MTLREGIYAILRIARRELRRLVANPVYFFCMVVAPVGCLFFFTTLMRSGLPTDLPVAVVDLDNTPTSRRLVRQLDAFEQTAVRMQCASFDEARHEMQQGSIYGVFLIPKHFQQDATSGKRPRLSFYTNGSFLIAGSLMFRDMKTLSVLAGASVGLQQGQARGMTDAQIMGQIQPITVDTHAIGNPWLNYSVYLSNAMLPGLLQLLVFIVTVYSIGAEIKQRTSRRWLSLGNGSLAVSLAGKLLPHTVIFTVVGLLICAVLYGYNAFPLASGWLPILVAMTLLVIASQAVGVFMIGVLPTVRLGLSFASLFGMLGFSICGLSYPVTAMYPPFHALSYLYPLRHSLLIYIDQALNGRALAYTWGEYVWLAAFFLLPLTIYRNLKRALLYFHYIP